MIHILSIGVSTPGFLAKKQLKELLRELIQKEGKTCGDISLVFTDDEYLLEVNKQFLDHDYYTDVITFDYCVDTTISGDVMISLDRVKDNASGLNITFQEELQRVIFHGVLHLCGYKDKSSDDVVLMRRKENEWIEAFVSRGTN
ncbi:MAG: hypothetical protein RLZZ301_172 [Bacteroidota bacterium]|jgi:rRNA maturation RNase YbeY